MLVQKYNVTIKTADKQNAGTDSNVVLTVFGTNNKNTGQILLDKNNSKLKKKGLFERNEIDEFEFDSVDIDKISSIKIGHDGTKIGSSWYLESITVKTPKDSQTWTVNKWLDEEDGTNIIELKPKETVKESPKLNMSKYDVIVKTGDKQNAGTDSKVLITIFGKTKNTGEILLDTINSKNKEEALFERAKVDEFEFDAEDVEKISRVKFGHDGSKMGSSWYVESLTVKSKSDQKTWIINKWLDEEDGTNMIELNSEIQKESPKEITKIIEKEKKETKDKGQFMEKKDDDLDQKAKNKDKNSNLKLDLNSKKSLDNLNNNEKLKRPKEKPVKPKGKNQEYTHVELKRIKDSLNRHVSQINFPKRQDHKPYVFNDLNPYYDVRHVEKLIKSPENSQPVGYYSRYTAMNIVEPWVAYRMEHTLAPIVARSLSHNATNRSQTESKFSDNRPNNLDGSTLAPNFPKVIIKKPKNLNGPFYVDDIQTIRKELKANLSNQTRFEEDRNRTINDYYRMNLDQTAEKEGMVKVYHAYLENSPGSKKALKELLSKHKKDSDSQNNDDSKQTELDDSSSKKSVEVD